MLIQYEGNPKFQPTLSDVERECDNVASLWGFKEHVFYNNAARASAWLHGKDVQVRVSAAVCHMSEHKLPEMFV